MDERVHKALTPEEQRIYNEIKEKLETEAAREHTFTPNEREVVRRMIKDQLEREAAGRFMRKWWNFTRNAGTIGIGFIILIMAFGDTTKSKLQALLAFFKLGG